MTITKDTLSNKLLLFCTAGYPASTGWDTAIPQSMFDMLLSWGIERPGAYFVMDCKSNPWALHHVGEALFDILEHRRQANGEKIAVMFEEDKPVWKFICDSRIHGALAEAEAGFLDLDFISAAWMNGWGEGRKAIIAEIKEAMSGVYFSAEAKEKFDQVLGNEK